MDEYNKFISTTGHEPLYEKQPQLELLINPNHNHDISHFYHSFKKRGIR